MGATDAQSTGVSVDGTPRSDIIEILYLFAGAARTSDVAFFLKSYSHYLQVPITLHEVDILRQPQAHNLCDQKVWDRIFSDIQRGRYLYVIMAPPCSTFSRARHEPPGPKPLRTSEWPRGFPWLAKSDHDEVTLANVLIDRVLQVATEQARQGHFFIIEHPEQLGISQGLVPASIWDWPEMRALVSEAQAGTFALHQCQFGSATQTNQVRHECARSHLLAGTALGLASARASLRICRPVTTSLPQRTS